ncbi:DeoR/GlpR family DNA-binding transcription regulator [Mycolicibacterium sp. 120266]|jgi:DeoR/GlpR family transcriptional regulator of sugar metabolism|uniref:DeoR/GlpR family DNA-binding transcription regulator n=1 Tax=Mycolicibacterium sp. 120266 TaxID=3090601 RepID=UPI00299E3489|nr:DeoR/GlpR family DNA-binding transcription regulator [Mycolicibacterium sp. 120266]MDX1876015.1 DeoR/GlpR family DNA-binding transcription regulator [Mycolicibacterium sp. 120266]
MLPVVRHDAIVDAVNTSTTVSTDELVRMLGVSAETVRRDLALLEERGALRRVHGGAATVAPRGEEPPFTERAGIHRPAKSEMARLAAGLLESGQTVTIDIGTTAVEVARAIPHGWRGTVATPSLLVAVELAGRPGINVLVSGGHVRGGDLACSNAHAKAMFADLYADIAFIGSGGVDAGAGLTDYHLDEVDVRRTIIANSARSFILADSSKLGQIAPHRVCGLAAVSGLITERDCAPAVTAAIREAGGVVLSA